MKIDALIRKLQKAKSEGCVDVVVNTHDVNPLRPIIKSYPLSFQGVKTLVLVTKKEPDERYAP